MKIDIIHLAKLANIPLKKEEENKLEKQLEVTLEHVKHLSELETSHIEVTNSVSGLVNITRPDETAPSLSQADALQNAKSTYNGFFKVPVILEEI